MARGHTNKRSFFDFGVCNEQGGRVLNTGSLNRKEGLGARTLTLDFYRFATKNYVNLLVVSEPLLC